MSASTFAAASLGKCKSAFTLEADVLSNYAHGVIDASTVLEMEADLALVEEGLAKWEKSNDTSSQEVVEALKRIVSLARSIQESLEKKFREGPEGTRSQIISTIKKVHKLGDAAGNAWVGVATPTVLYVKHDFLIKTSYGDWLTQKHWLGLTITFLLVLLGLIGIISRQFSEPLIMWEGEKELILVRRSSVWWLMMLMVSSITLFHIAHRVNRDILYMSCQYFEFIIIVGSQIGTRFFWMYNIYSTFYPAGLYDLEWQIWDTLITILLDVPMTVFVASMDGFHVRWRGIKSIIIALFFLSHAWKYVQFRYLEGSWSSQDMELFGWKLGTARQLYSQMEAQMCIFLFKLLLAQLTGRTWVMLKPEYLPPKHNDVVDSDEAVLSADSTSDLQKDNWLLANLILHETQ